MHKVYKNTNIFDRFKRYLQEIKLVQINICLRWIFTGDKIGEDEYLLEMNIYGR